MYKIKMNTFYIIKKKRICLVCNNPFLSDGPHNRRCGKCNRQLSMTYSPTIYKVHEWKSNRNI